MEYTIVSSLPHVVCISVSNSSHCVQNHYNRPTLVSRKKTCVSVWLLVCSSEVGAPFHYALMPLKTDTRQKIGGDKSCTHVPTWQKHWGTLTNTRTDHTPYSVHTLTPIIVTNQIKKHLVLFTLPHVTHTVDTRTNQTDTWQCLTYTLNHS